ncbi:hypothetical protein SAMN04489760_10631 [Syntrophus gentianae]|uniref:Uncharacterized protein n=1 Tax=Syntrophus gentianae TaxID=43775 RepID=A0A1H7WA04_9BACT|nr:hypothetical protein [Syntrophus gentianae]SEM18340.1 hypothetical protein SAMN04489760_10631 [Syntrophus gentianae]
MNPDQLMDNLIKELNAALKAMSKAKTVEEKVMHSQVVKNLTESLGVFLNLASNMMGDDFDDFYEND